MRAAMVVLLSLIAVSAQAEVTAQEWAKRTEERAGRLGELTRADVTGEAGPQIEVIRTLLTRAEGHLSNEDLEALPPLFARIDLMLAWVVAMETRMVAERNAEAVEQEAKIAVDKAEAAEAQVEQLRTRFEELEAKGL